MNTAISSLFQLNAEASCYEVVFHKHLQRIDHGVLEIVAPDGEVQRYGKATPDGLSATIIINNARAYSRIILNGSLGAAESFMEGEWTSPNLTDVIRIFTRNIAMVNTALERGLARDHANRVSQDDRHSVNSTM